MIGIISGSGIDQWPGLIDRQIHHATTPFGSVNVTLGTVGDTVVAHVSRHGPSHERLSHQVNHKANLSALIDLGVSAVIGCTACGAVQPSIEPGSLIVFDDLYFGSNRMPDGSLCTWFDTPGQKDRGHWIFDHPFSDDLRNSLINAGKEFESKILTNGVYGHVDGPRFNSRTEISALAACGVTAISQTGGPETVLAGEAQLPYALVGYVTDYANGVANVPEPIEALVARMRVSADRFAELIRAALPLVNAHTPQPAGEVFRVES
ncbi:MTAP family purine nucleoside phosphorylase [Ferrimicrobium sp.]|uniref:MTAP family purine nucleoside phosphorylase n=1 Tax=Ferrimicrobium sp. TaxID=2926050 RepID=UPI002610C04B|nr:MTAP family purine nucleoside phosphorylase [Ferrimicrobium sp.]